MGNKCFLSYFNCNNHKCAFCKKLLSDRSYYWSCSCGNKYHTDCLSNYNCDCSSDCNNICKYNGLTVIRNMNNHNKKNTTIRNKFIPNIEYISKFHKQSKT